MLMTVDVALVEPPKRITLQSLFHIQYMAIATAASFVDMEVNYYHIGALQWLSDYRHVNCRDLFKKVHMLLLSCEYIPSLIMFVIDNQTKMCSNLDIHGLNARNQKQLYLPNLSLCFSERHYVYRH
jgi:hypothetical protein